ncbi:indolepyruvate oxidoreductase subunit beta [Methanofollis fontis]|uniref:Indolepyruvate ferredoxin oxidoreductase subunit beta n=1 Tax=Methanofollis fontis TaxID=2052832 RepID=A0A483CXQ8_9EURY|nr:indolepyruvate oxidoreductase subunit beta [Methanofollis fontis]TAJ44133.1 indolepyruvate ferredoxin oxidoreductase subunit beta [Methanofollis fontis]
MSDSYDVLIVGIGGQGTILASNILGNACLAGEMPVRGVETHGMAQRGGSVESHVRIGGRHGPLIPAGGADLMIALDLLEAVRYRHYLKPDGQIIVNDRTVVPTSVFTARLQMPSREDLIAALDGYRITVIDAEALAAEAGNPIVGNVVMLGAASRHLPLGEQLLRDAVARSVPKKTQELNLKAFDLGRAAAAFE